jgi:hypothetical protein
MKTLTNKRWKQHPWALNDLVLEMEVSFLKKIANLEATDHTDLLNGDIVHQDLVWNNIKEEGLQEPLLIIIGYDNKTIRLESGNHRITTAIADGYTHLPVAVQVIKRNLLEKGNGLHFFDAKDIVDWTKIIKCPYPYQISPKKIFNNDIIL